MTSPRVKQFVIQQSDDEPDLDEVMITLHRVSSAEYAAICAQLRALPGVKDFAIPVRPFDPGKYVANAR